MITLIERMRQELVRRNYAATTIRSYIKAVEHFQQHISMPLEAIGPDDVRSYHAYLLGERKLAVKTVVVKVCALRFLYIKVLKRRDMKEDLPYPKERKQLPVILSPAEVARLWDSARNLPASTAELGLLGLLLSIIVSAIVLLRRIPARGRRIAERRLG